MSTTIELPDDVIARLQAEAARRGVAVEDLIAEFAAGLRAEPGASPRRPAFIGLGTSVSGRSARDADEMLAEGFGRD